MNARAGREAHADGDRGMAGKMEGRATASEDHKPSLLSDYARKDELAREFDVSERTIERWVRLRLLPPPIRLGRTALHHIPTLKQHLVDQTSDKIRWRSRKIRRRSRKPA